MKIVIASDDNYAIGVITLIGSIALNDPGGNVVVIDLGISAKRRAEIDRLNTDMNIYVERLELSSNSLDHLPIRNSMLNTSIYLRLLTPSLFPNDDQVLYLDSDMLVLDSLAELMSLDLGDNLIAAVPDPSPPQRELDSTGLSLGTYINSGLMIINLALWRKEGTAEKCVEFLMDEKNDTFFEDQSAMNVICKGRILRLPARYNVLAMAHCHTFMPGTLPNDPAIFHYISVSKPWLTDIGVVSIWREYLKRTNPDLVGSFYPLPRQPRPTFRKRLSRLNRHRKQFISWLIRDKDSIRRTEMERIRRRMLRIEEDCLKRLESLPAPKRGA